MESVLEEERSLHEERERLEQAMVGEMMFKKTTHREHINSDQRLRYLLDRYMDSSSKLRDHYVDEAGTREADIKAISAPNEFSEFYLRFRAIKDHYRGLPNEISVPMSDEFERFANSRSDPAEQVLVQFTDEEGYGKFLDLHLLHDKFINLKGITAEQRKTDYLSYLTQFDQLFELMPREKKTSTSDYKRYLNDLLDYLSEFLSKTKPLLDLTEELNTATQNFDLQWDEGSFPGWPKEKTSSLSQSGAPLDLMAFDTAAELSSLGLDRLKFALVALGLKCGGTLEERAQRLWSVRGKSPSEIDPSLFNKSQKKGKDTATQSNGNHSNGTTTTDKSRDIACIEAQIYRLAELVSEQRAATRENVLRKQARTAGERDNESDEEDDGTGTKGAGHGSDDDGDGDDDEVIYNPKNLPLGWDGKPIPYWLYKLHGLNIEYNCEICGNSTYKGPKAFQRHFAEWRHAHGMRCLGIPNTAHFANVTSIADAVQLWNKLKDEKSKEKFNPLNEEEYEDSAGNVVTKKVYEDLKRQGLL